MASCKFSGCRLQCVGRNLCRGHYSQEMRGQDLRPLREKFPAGEFCLFPECGERRKAKGLCAAHWLQRHEGKKLKKVIRLGADLCSFEGCDKRSTRFGLCQPHRRQRKRGASLKPLAGHSVAPFQRFWRRVRKTEGCWIWTGKRSNGYGVIMIDGKAMLAHRYSFVLHFGDVPVGLFVCHRCDNPPCVRPDHLFAGTCADNIADMVSKGRGHKGPRAPSVCVLSPDAVRTIRSSRLRGPALAARFGVSASTISRVRRRTAWAHVE